MIVKRGEVWIVCLDPTIGAEINKTRTCVVVNNNGIGVLPLKIIVPITEWKEKFSVAPWLIELNVSAANGLKKKSAADTFQVRSVSESRFVNKLGELTSQDLEKINIGLSICLCLNKLE